MSYFHKGFGWQDDESTSSGSSSSQPTNITAVGLVKTNPDPIQGSGVISLEAPANTILGGQIGTESTGQAIALSQVQARQVLGIPTVTPGSYTNANITIDEHGHVVSAGSGASSGGAAQLTAVQSTVVANSQSLVKDQGTNGTALLKSIKGTTGIATNSDSDTIDIYLTDTGITPGVYNSLTIDGQGRATAGTVESAITTVQTSNAPASQSIIKSTTSDTLTLKQIAGAYGIATNSDSDKVDVYLTDTGVTPGAYTNSNLTVDGQGRITSISNGTSSGLSNIAAKSLMGNNLVTSGPPGELTWEQARFILKLPPSGVAQYDIPYYSDTDGTMATSGIQTSSLLTSVVSSNAASSQSLIKSVASSNTGSTLTLKQIKGSLGVGTNNSADTVDVFLQDTGVTPGTYNSVTVDGQGRVTAATNTSSGGIQSISGLGPIPITGTTDPIINMANSSESAGWYNSVRIDSRGIVQEGLPQVEFVSIAEPTPLDGYSALFINNQMELIHKSLLGGITETTNITQQAKTNVLYARYGDIESGGSVSRRDPVSLVNSGNFQRLEWNYTENFGNPTCVCTLNDNFNSFTLKGGRKYHIRARSGCIRTSTSQIGFYFNSGGIPAKRGASASSNVDSWNDDEVIPVTLDCYVEKPVGADVTGHMKQFFASTVAGANGVRLNHISTDFYNNYHEIWIEDIV